jgi:hypothetical protein
MLDTQIDTSKFEAAMREMAKVSKKDLDSVVSQQARIMVGNLIAITPPADGKGTNLTDHGGIDIKAKKAGESRIAADIAALFPTTKMKPASVEQAVEAGFEWGTGKGRKIIHNYAPTEADLHRFHQAARDSQGRTRTGGNRGSNMAITHAAVLRSYIKKQQARVGLLNAGWINAARELGTAKRATPAWITRHPNQPGGSNKNVSEGKVFIRVFNSQAWFPRRMESRIKIAMDRRTVALRMDIKKKLEFAAARAQARQR